MTTGVRRAIALAFTAGIVGFTFAVPVHADGNGCDMGKACQVGIIVGSCGFSTQQGKDYCTCFSQMGTWENTCDCADSTNEWCNQNGG